MITPVLVRRVRIIWLFPVLWVWVLSALVSCGGGKDRVIQAAVAERIAEFRKKEIIKCRELLLMEAGKTVDSLLLNEALSEVNDSIARLRPFKPVKPADIPPIDSASVKPVFKR